MRAYFQPRGGDIIIFPYKPNFLNRYAYSNAMPLSTASPKG